MGVRAVGMRIPPSATKLIAPGAVERSPKLHKKFVWGGIMLLMVQKYEILPKLLLALLCVGTTLKICLDKG